MAHVEYFKADYCGTEAHNAVRAAIDSRFAELACKILPFTDGDIWRQHKLFAYLNDVVGNSIRVFPLRIGDGVFTSLIEGVTRAGKGFTQVVGEDYTMEMKYENFTDEQGGDITWEIVEKVTASGR